MLYKCCNPLIINVVLFLCIKYWNEVFVFKLCWIVKISKYVRVIDFIDDNTFSHRRKMELRRKLAIKKVSKIEMIK